MNLEEYNADTLRQLVRDLQEENNELRRQLREKKIPTAGSHIFQARRNEELYDPDQGARIEHPWITEKMVQYFYSVFHGRRDVYARRGKKGGYYPQCANGWSRECPWHNGNSRFCLANQCPVRRWKPLNGNILRAHLLGMSESGEDAIGLTRYLKMVHALFLYLILTTMRKEQRRQIFRIRTKNGRMR